MSNSSKSTESYPNNSASTSDDESNPKIVRITPEPKKFPPPSRLKKVIGFTLGFLRSAGAGALAFFGIYFFMSTAFGPAAALIFAGVLGLGRFLGSLVQYSWDMNKKLAETKFPWEGDKKRFAPKKFFEKIAVLFVERTGFALLALLESALVSAALFSLIYFGIASNLAAALPLTIACFVFTAPLLLKRTANKLLGHSERRNSVETPNKPKNFPSKRLNLFKRVNNTFFKDIFVFLSMMAEGLGLGAGVYVTLFYALGAPIGLAISVALVVGIGSFLLASGRIAKKVGTKTTFEDKVVTAEKQFRKEMATLETKLDALNESDASESQSKEMDAAFSASLATALKNFHIRILKLKQKINDGRLSNEEKKIIQDDATPHTPLVARGDRRIGRITGRAVSFVRAVGVAALTAIGIIALVTKGALPMALVAAFVIALTLGLARGNASYSQYTTDLQVNITKMSQWCRSKLSPKPPKFHQQTKQIKLKQNTKRSTRIKNKLKQYSLLTLIALADGFSNFTGVHGLAVKLPLVIAAITCATIAVPNAVTIPLGIIVGAITIVVALGLMTRKVRENILKHDPDVIHTDKSISAIQIMDASLTKLEHEVPKRLPQYESKSNSSSSDKRVAMAECLDDLAGLTSQLKQKYQIS